MLVYSEDLKWEFTFFCENGRDFLVESSIYNVEWWGILII